MTRHRKTTAAVLWMFAATFPAAATTYTTIADGSWSSAATWDAAGIPPCVIEGSDVVVINHAVSVACDVEINDDVRLTVSAGATLTATGAIEVKDDAVLTVNGNLVYTDILEVKNNAAFSVGTDGAVSGSGRLTIQNNVGLTINGSVEVSDGIYIEDNVTVSGPGTLYTSVHLSVAEDVTWSGVYWCSEGTEDIRSPSVPAEDCSTVLPIELIAFSATLTEDQKIKLDWSTASEQNNDYFTIERSRNGATFEDLLTVKGAGNSSVRKEYSTVDVQPIPGTSYYRLRQTDYNGNFERFHIVAVSYEITPGGSCVLKVMPNPCLGQCRINLEECRNHEQAEIIVEIMDAAGNKVYSQIPYRQEDGSFSFSVDVHNNLKPGIYIISGRSSGESYNEKMIAK